MQWRSLVTDMQVIKQTILFVLSVPGSAKKNSRHQTCRRRPPLPRHNIEMTPRAAKEQWEKTAVYFARPERSPAVSMLHTGGAGGGTNESHLWTGRVFFSLAPESDEGVWPPRLAVSKPVGHSCAWPVDMHGGGNGASAGCGGDAGVGVWL